jgi:F-type H+-transporting ATPase subunit gamma
MVNAKQIKSKIKSVGNIKQITKALEVVATVKLQKTKAKTDTYKEFMIEFLKIVKAVTQGENIFQNETHPNPQTDKELAIIIGTDRGLCGALNNRLFKDIFSIYEDKKETVDMFCIGRKALEFFSRANFPIVGQHELPDTFDESTVKELYTFLRTAVAEHTYTNIKVYFNFFHNAIKQTPLSLQLFPLNKESFKNFAKDLEINIDELISTEEVYQEISLEPTPAELARDIKEQLIQHMIYGAILQNKTGEFAARMVAMKNAKDNSMTMIKNLTLSYNKARQTAVTQEVSEIMGAKMALED